jgi:DNA-binding response OmpR family regulator
MSQPKKIAIFDDDEDILSICRYIMEDAGWQVFTFEDCNDVLHKVESVSPNVILMDNWIPDQGGIVATRTLKGSATVAHIPVIYFSANSEIDQLAAKAGAETYIAKPFDLEELTRKIDQVLQSAR